MLNEPTIYRTADGDMLDAICAAHYDGETSMLPAVFAANPGIAAHPPVLPAGILITLPPASRPARETARLWG